MNITVQTTKGPVRFHSVGESIVAQDANPTIGFRYQCTWNGHDYYEYLCPSCFLAEALKPYTYLGDDSEAVTDSHLDDRIVSCAHCGKALNS